MRTSFKEWKLKTQLFFIVLIVILLLSGSLIAYFSTSTLNAARRSIESYRETAMDERRAILRDFVALAYETLQAHYDDAADPDWLEAYYGKEIRSVVEIAESTVRNSIRLEQAGRLTRRAAQSEAVAALRTMRFDGGREYLWINDTGKPYPRMVMHPLSPELEGSVLDNPVYDTVRTSESGIESEGSTRNLYAVAAETGLSDGAGFIHYEWPKTLRDGTESMKPKLSYVTYVPEWDWVIGTGLFMDGAMQDAKAASMETVRDMRYANGKGYFWINDMDGPVPDMLMHPLRPDLEGKKLDHPSFEVVGEEEKNFYAETLEITGMGGTGYISYLQPGSGEGDQGASRPKIAYVRPFEQWDWVIGTETFVDDIEKAAEENRIESIKRLRLSILLFAGITAAVAVAALLSTSAMIGLVTKPIGEVVDWSRSLADGDLTLKLNNVGRSEIGQQGRNLNKAAESIRSLMNTIKELTGAADAVKERLADSASKTTQSIESISGNLASVDGRFEELGESIGASTSAADTISANIVGLETQIARQAAAVEESSAAMEEMLRALNAVNKTCKDRGEAIEGLRATLGKCRERFDRINSSIEALAEAGEGMTNIASVIGSIAGRTNLLSMNAAIEAAHAGDAGRGFAVVAEEMRALSGNAAENANRIKSMLDGNVGVIRTLIEDSRHLNGIYGNMENEVSSLADSLIGISSTMAEMSEGSKELLESVESLRDISSEVLAGSREMSAGNDVVAETLGGVNRLSSEVEKSLSEVLEGTGRIGTTMRDLDEHVRRMVESISNINEEVHRFRT